MVFVLLPWLEASRAAVGGAALTLYIRYQRRYDLEGYSVLLQHPVQCIEYNDDNIVDSCTAAHLAMKATATLMALKCTATHMAIAAHMAAQVYRSTHGLKATATLMALKCTATHMAIAAHMAAQVYCSDNAPEAGGRAGQQAVLCAVLCRVMHDTCPATLQGRA